MSSRRSVLRVVNLLLGAALTGPCLASSQDLVSVAPDAARVEYEDARVRVVRLRIAPDASLPMHDRPARVVIALTPNDVRISDPDGTTRTTRTAAGRVAWSERTRRGVTNLAGTALENLIVELKTAGAPARSSASPQPPPPDYLAEPRHQWLFENQYVRVYEVRIPPGETTDLHRHAYDGLSLFLSGGVVASQVQGEPWGKPEQIPAGGVAFSAYSKTPIVHRVRNDGTADYHLIHLQLLR